MLLVKPACDNLRDAFIGKCWILDAANAARYPIFLEHKMERNIVCRGKY